MSDSISMNPKEWMWEQKYRPTRLSECILTAEDRKKFEGIVKQGRISHLTLVSRSPGTGKTTMATVLVNELKAKMLFVNGADCKIDYIRNELTRFASSMCNTEKYPGGKIIVIDEFDRKNLADAQRHLRSFMEEYSSNCSIIMTANNEEGIIGPLKSRAPVITFGKADRNDKIKMMREMIIRCKEILAIEKIPLEDDRVLAMLVKENFPDFRKTIKMLDLYSKTGQIDAGILSQSKDATDVATLIEHLKNKDFKQIRGITEKYVYDYPSFIRELYEELYKEAQPSSIPTVIEIIGQNQMYYQQVANLNIHISYLLVQLMLEVQWK